ncbi:MAG TPA: phosphotransferase [Acidobacteriaceae bacterium]|nr:phosphotransferase [Acidobacteriaceae bacterium]
MTESEVVEACLILAQRLGLGTVTPQVIGRFSNLAIALDPLPVVARVATGTALLRDTKVFARREVEIAGFLARKGASVVAPCEAALAGPHDVSSWTISLWQRVEILSEPPDAAEAGRRLAACHAWLREYSGSVSYFGAFDELEKLLQHPAVQDAIAEKDRKLVAQRAQSCRCALEEFFASYQVVHGDSHRKNVFSTREGPLWADWEDAIFAPVEWDLACLVTEGRILGRDGEWGEAALAAYGNYNAAALELCIQARALFAIGWLGLLSSEEARRQDRRERLAIWLNWVRRRQG